MLNHRLVGALLTGAAIIAGCGSSSGTDGQSRRAAETTETVHSSAHAKFCTATRTLLEREPVFFPPDSATGASAQTDRLSFIAGNAQIFKTMRIYAPPALRAHVVNKIADLHRRAQKAARHETRSGTEATVALKRYVRTRC
jgi:hypothetical protein